MDKENKVKVGEVVCYWLAYGQPYAATVTEVYEDQINSEGGPTVDLLYEGQERKHVSYDPVGQPHSYCRADDRGWPGTLARQGLAEPAEAPAEPAGPSVASTPTTSKRAEPK